MKMPTLKFTHKYVILHNFKIDHEAKFVGPTGPARYEKVFWSILCKRLNPTGFSSTRSKAMKWAVKIETLPFIY